MSPCKFSPGGEHRRLARAELLAPHLVRLEIVIDVLAQQDLAAHFNPHVAVGHRLARLPGSPTRCPPSAPFAVFHANAVRAGDGASCIAEVHAAVGWRAGNDLIERPCLPSPAAPAPKRRREKSRQKKSARQWRAFAAPECRPPLIHANRGFWFACVQHRLRPRRRAIFSFGAAN